MNEETKFLAWHKKEVDKGLVDIKFYVGEGSRDEKATTEEFFHEANLVNDLYDEGRFIPRPDIY